jgi:hypothetical protein
VPLSQAWARHAVVVEALSSGAILLALSIGLWFAYDHEKVPPEQRYTYHWVFIESRRWLSVVAKRAGIPVALLLMLAGLVQLVVEA